MKSRIGKNIRMLISFSSPPFSTRTVPAAEVTDNSHREPSVLQKLPESIVSEGAGQKRSPIIAFPLLSGLHQDHRSSFRPTAPLPIDGLPAVDPASRGLGCAGSW